MSMMSLNVMKMNYELIRPYPQLVAEFERSYREHLCSFDFTNFLAGGARLNDQAYHDAFTRASQDTATLARTLFISSNDIKYVELAVMLWNPLVEQVTTEVATTSIQPQVRSTEPKPSTSSFVPDSVRVPNPQREEKNLRRALELRTRSNKPFYPYLCTSPQCRECLELFKHAPVSSCRTHNCLTLCTPLGWFPHIPSKVLDENRVKHNAGTLSLNPWQPRPMKFQKLNPLRRIPASVGLPPSPQRTEPNPSSICSDTSVCDEIVTNLNWEDEVSQEDARLANKRKCT